MLFETSLNTSFNSISDVLWMVIDICLLTNTDPQSDFSSSGRKSIAYSFFFESSIAKVHFRVDCFWWWSSSSTSPLMGWRRDAMSALLNILLTYLVQRSTMADSSKWLNACLLKNFLRKKCLFSTHNPLQSWKDASNLFWRNMYELLRFRMPTFAVCFSLKSPIRISSHLLECY